MGFQNGMGVWGKGQLEHVSDGELLNSTLWITFWRDYKMIFSIGSLARARVILFSVQKFQFSVQTSNQFYRFPRTRGDRPRVCPIYLGLWTLA